MGHSNFAIVVSGGPAPGINSVISSIVISAERFGSRCFGLNQGFIGVCEEQPNAILELHSNLVSRTFNQAGSILGISRYNPLISAKSERNLFSCLEQHQISDLVVIGGDGSAYLSRLLSQKQSRIRIWHVPKTIDNDLVLPDNNSCFGFETARNAGSAVVRTLMLDSKTEGNRWFLVESMGRKAGFLALGIGLASSATLTLIPEEFTERSISLSDLADIILVSIKKRAEQSKYYGVAILSEGLLDCIDPEKSPELKELPRDELGRIRYSQIELGDLLIPILKQQLIKSNLKTRISAKNIGYELRCADPISSDIEYTRMLGYGVVKFAKQRSSTLENGQMICFANNQLLTVPLSRMLTESGVIQSRRVDLNSDLYQVARSFMIR